MVIDFSNLGGGGGGGEYVLPTATKTRLGGIKVGDGLEYKNDGTINVTGTTETDNITTEIVAEKLQANAIIDVDTLPSTGIKANSVYRLNVQKLYDVDGEEMTPLVIYSATSESITFSENGMDFDGVVTPFSSFTDSFVNGYAADNYFVPDIKATSSEKNFVKLGEDSYAYIDQIENKKVLYFRDGNEWKEVGGDIELDELTTEMDEGKLQANAIIDVENLPTTGIKTNSIYRKDVQKLYDVENEEITPLAIYSASSELITFTENGMDFDGVVTPFSSITDSLVDDYLLQGYLMTTDKATSSEKNFVKVDTDSYAYIDRIENSKYLFYRDGSNWKQVGSGESETIDVDGLTTEMVNEKLQANAIIDVTTLPTTGIKTNSVYRIITQVIYDEDGYERTPLAIYTATSDDVEISASEINIVGKDSPYYIPTLSDVTVENVLIGEGYFTITETAESPTKSFVKADDENQHYFVIGRIENVNDLYYRDGNEWKKVGEINIDNETTEMVDNNLQANAIIDVENLPSTDIKANSVYRKDVQRFFDENDEELTPLAIYVDSSSTISVTQQGIQLEGEAVTPWSSIDDETVEGYLSNEYFTVEDKAVSNSNSFIKTGTDSYSYIYRLVTEKELFYRNGNLWKMIGGGGGGGTTIELDEVTTEMADNKLQANALVRVNALPSTDIKANSLYAVTENVSYTNEEWTYNGNPIDEVPTSYVIISGCTADANGINIEPEEGGGGTYYFWVGTEGDDVVNDDVVNGLLDGGKIIVGEFSGASFCGFNGQYDYHTKFSNSGETKSFSMYKTFKRDGNNWVSISTISLTSEEYDHLSEAQKMDGTVYIVDDLTPVITDEFSYDILANKPEINGITLQGTLSLEDINVYSRTDVNNLLSNKGEVEFVNQLPATPDENTWYYSKKYEDGTDVANDKRALYIVLDDVTVYNYMGVVGDVDLTAYYTKTEIDDKLSDLTVNNFRSGVIVTTIGTSTGNSTIPTGGAVRVALNNKQDTIVASDQSTNPTDTDKLSYVNNTTNNRWTFAKIWSWIVTKLTANTEKGIQVSSGKLGHSNSITAPSSTARFILGVLDAQGHFTGTPTAFTHSDVYSSSADNTLFTRKGANNLYNWAKITDASGANAVVTTGMDSALSRTAHSHQSTTSRVMKYGGVVSLQYFGQYSTSSAINGKFTCIGSVPASYKPASQTAIQVTSWNIMPAASSCGYVTTDGKIYVWVSSVGSGQTNIQFCINATWKAAS